mgnify:FL=1
MLARQGKRKQPQEVDRLMKHKQQWFKRLIPQPQTVRWMAASPQAEPESVRGATHIVWTDCEDPRVAARLEMLFGDVRLGQVRIELLEVSPRYPQFGDDESYAIKIDPHGVVLSAPTTWGALYAVTSLWMLYCDGGWSSKPLSVSDEPRFGWRGLLIDVARHFISLERLLSVVEGMARLKMNVLHLHLTDDQAFRLPSAAFKKLTTTPGYSVAQLRHLVEFAAARGVRVVPELDMPGHVNSWLEHYPEWGLARVARTDKFGVHKACLNPVSEVVYAAIDQLLGDLTDIFVDRYVHIGGDEVHPAWWSEDLDVQQFMEEQKLPDIVALQAYFNRRVSSLVAAHDRQVVGWDEVLHAQMPSMLVQNWRGATTRDRVLEKGLNVLVSAGYYLDLFYPAEFHYSYEPEAKQDQLIQYEDGLRKDIRLEHVARGIAWTDHWRADAVDLKLAPRPLSRVLGGEACLWSELVDDTNLETRLWSRLPAIAERLWSAKDVCDVDDFYRRLSFCVQLPGFELDERQHRALSQIGLNAMQIRQAMFLEPVKWYARLLGDQALNARLRGQEMPQARPYNTLTRLNKIVDHISPESLSARSIEDLSVEQLLGLVRDWVEINPAGWPVDAQAAVSALRCTGETLAEFLHQIQIKPTGSQQVSARLEDLYGPHGEYMLAVIPSLLKWLENASAKIR